LYTLNWVSTVRGEVQIQDERLQRVIITMERYIDQLEGENALRIAKQQARIAFNEATATEGTDGVGRNVASAVLDVAGMKFLPGWNPYRDREFGTRNEEAERTAQDLLHYQSGLLRCIFGNPFRLPPPMPPAVLAWNDRTVPRLAQAAYDERHLPEGTLDTGRLGILADALLDAECDNEELIAHCRSEGPHVRGCWAIDAILGKS
jgi:hypothetical protein